MEEKSSELQKTFQLVAQLQDVHQRTELEILLKQGNQALREKILSEPYPEGLRILRLLGKVSGASEWRVSDLTLDQQRKWFFSLQKPDPQKK